jgi:hypothetical protein
MYSKLLNIPCHALSKDELKVFKGQWRDLLGNAWLFGETIDQVIVQLIKDAKLERAFCVPEVNYTLICGHSYTQTIHFAANNMLLNYDVLLVPVNHNQHWMLGVVLFETKTIILVDSFNHIRLGDSGVAKSVFKNLFVLAVSAKLATGLSASTEEWRFVYAVDAPIQNDGTECGVIVCLNVLSLVSRVSYPTNTSLNPTKHHRNRRWMLDCLDRSTKINVKPQKVIKKRIPKSHMEVMLSKLAQLITEDINIVSHENSWGLIIHAMFYSKSSWTVCAEKDCVGDDQHGEDQFMCVECRQWVHRFCSQIEKVKECDYFICSSCMKLN